MASLLRTTTADLNEKFRHLSLIGGDLLSRGTIGAQHLPHAPPAFQGTLENSREEAARRNRWLLVSLLQSAAEFAPSRFLDRDKWASNEFVAQVIASNFVFRQYEDGTEEAQKVLRWWCSCRDGPDPAIPVQAPAVLVMEPYSGRVVRSWSGAVGPFVMVEDCLMPFPGSHPIRVPFWKAVQL